ncbi:MAG TPA: hypothetical protein VFW19_10755 [Allosphingosinicella sp.]|nr:hypothetical protein [Allosphingosinicella sp.]
MKVLAAMLAILSSGAMAAPGVKHHVVGGQCGALAERYRSDVDAVSRYAAFNAEAAEHLPGSQQSAAQARESNAMARARMSLEAARGAGCHVTPLAPQPERYGDSAASCAVELIGADWGGALPENCNPTRWPKR